MRGRLTEFLSSRARAAISKALDVDAEPDVRPTSDAKFGDFQVNGVLPLAKTLRDNPRKLAAKVVGPLAEVLEGVISGEPEIAGPGFINLRLDPAWMGTVLAAAASDARVGVPPTEAPKKVVVDFSSPNVAKRMHVGHLRSTILGDALVRTMRFVGHDVVGDNHVGDWGTQFGILIWAYRNHADEAALAGDDAIGELERLYKLGNAAQKDDETIAKACREELAKLQSGDTDNLALWERFVAISRADAQRLYDRLDVSFDTWLGESHFNDALPGIVEDLTVRGIARESEGAIAVFFDGHPKLEDKPFLIRKSDGAFLYSTTDIATVQHRLDGEKADRVVYVVDVRQSNHFDQLFETVRKMGYDADFQHIGFGMILGPDGRPFRTRDGGTVTLESLLDEAEERALPLVKERWPDADEATLRAIAAEVGVGAVKYADMNQNLATDYKFVWDRMVAFEGDTGPYLQYSLVRTKSLGRKYEATVGAPFSAEGVSLALDTPEERALALRLLQFGDTLERTSDKLRPNILCEYLYSLARAFNPFYEACPVLHTDVAPGQRDSRMALVHLTCRTLELGLACLNLPRVERM